MKVLVLKLWADDQEPWAVFKFNADGRISYNLDAVPHDIKLHTITVEPDDPDSKVEMTHYGARYKP